MDEKKRLEAIKNFSYYDFDNEFYWQEWHEKNEILQAVNRKMEEKKDEKNSKY